MRALSLSLEGKRGYLLVALAVLLVDQWSKWLVETRLAGHGRVRVIPELLDFTYVRNTGVAFGLLPADGNLAGTLLLILLGLGGFGLLAYYFLKTPADNRLLLLSLGLVLGGAVGNLADRIASGAVTDFVDFYIGSYHWYTFNVADSAITIGIVLMSAELLLPRRKSAPSDTAPAGDRAAPS